jgi:hypothetical protein
MKRLHVVLVHRDHWLRWERVDGQFAYPVEEFTWEHQAVPKKFRMDLTAMAGAFDLVWWDEGKHGFARSMFCPPRGDARPVPVVYYALYPTLDEWTYGDRVERAQMNADAVAVEHDDLRRWADVGMPAFRCAYSVNEEYYRPAEKTVDVGHYCIWSHSWERAALDEWLEGYCRRRGWTFASNRGNEMGRDYADALARTRVVVHMNRTPLTRPPRIFDAAACGAALLANPMPAVSGEEWEEGYHYAAFRAPVCAEYKAERREMEPLTDGECEDVAAKLEWLMAGNWEAVAGQAQQYVLTEHTWRVRAGQLRAALGEALGL